MVELGDELNATDDQHYIGMIKQLKDGIHIKGVVLGIQKYSPNPDGDFEKDGIRYSLVEEKRVNNTVTNLGNALAARRFASAVETVKATHMAVGTGTPDTKSSVSQTLQVEVGRVALDASGTPETPATVPAEGAANDNVVTYVATFPAGTGTGALVEAAIFTAAVLGVMICYAVFGVVTKAAADIIIFTWTLTFGTT